MDYIIWINKVKVPVTEQVYRAYWQGHRKERYFTESDYYNKTLYYNALDTNDTNGCELFCDGNETSAEDLAMEHM